MLQSSQKLLTALVTLLDDKLLTKITTLDLIRTLVFLVRPSTAIFRISLGSLTG